MQEEKFTSSLSLLLVCGFTYERDICFPVSLVAVEQKHVIKGPHSPSSDKPQRLLSQPQDTLTISVRPLSFAGSFDIPMDKGCFSFGHREISAPLQQKAFPWGSQHPWKCHCRA